MSCLLALLLYPVHARVEGQSVSLGYANQSTQFEYL